MQLKCLKTLICFTLFLQYCETRAGLLTTFLSIAPLSHVNADRPAQAGVCGAARSTWRGQGSTLQPRDYLTPPLYPPISMNSSASLCNLHGLTFCPRPPQRGAARLEKALPDSLETKQPRLPLVTARVCSTRRKQCR